MSLLLSFSYAFQSSNAMKTIANCFVVVDNSSCLPKEVSTKTMTAMHVVSHVLVSVFDVRNLKCENDAVL